MPPQKQAVDTLRDRNLNNSYGAAYAPWVRIRDSVNQRTLWAPPSVAALGVLSTTDNNQGPWFAPAGFTRGGLTEGAAGIPVLDVSRKYTQDQRDDLYEANINPIAKFPAEGIVIFGQKTLQQTRSALDRINVRRLMIFLKREISFIASRLLFDPNTSNLGSLSAPGRGCVSMMLSQGLVSKSLDLFLTIQRRHQTWLTKTSSMLSCL